MNTNLLRILHIFIVIIIQVVVLNNISFYGFITPYVYLLYLYWLPTNSNNIIYLFLSFCIGLIIDSFLDTTSIHTITCVTITYIRPLLLKLFFGNSYLVKDDERNGNMKIIYFIVMIFLHHLILFSLEYFSLDSWLFILKASFFSSLSTIVLTILIKPLFEK